MEEVLDRLHQLVAVMRAEVWVGGTLDVEFQHLNEMMEDAIKHAGWLAKLMKSKKVRILPRVAPERQGGISKFCLGAPE